MVKSIYTDLETDRALEIITKRDTAFNSSAFFKEKIIQFAGLGDKLNLDIIRGNIASSEQKIKTVEEDMNFWKSKETEALVQVELEKKEEREKIRTEIAEEEKSKQVKIGIFQTFQELSGRKMTDRIYEEYVEKRSAGKVNIWNFSDLYITNEKKQEVAA